MAGRITYVTGDDDINYCVLATLLVERKGADFTGADVQKQWQLQLSPAITFGPERTMLLRRGAAGNNYAPVDEADAMRWPTVLNPGSELCGAFIRVDAYGWAAIGRPALAAELAWRDAATTHVRTGVYSAMWIAALLAAAPFVDAWDDLARLSLTFVPQRSRFARRGARVDRRRRVSRRLVVGESRARDPSPRRGALHDHARGRHLAQYAALRPRHGRRHLSAGIAGQRHRLVRRHGRQRARPSVRFRRLDHGQWITPFNDDLRLAMVLPPERSLAAMAERVSRLPKALERRYG